MKHGSLFSGIGGFDLAAEWMGWDNLFHCEWNEFGQRVLKHYWPNAESFNDITKTDFRKYANRIDILTGGFPCQPYSAAGKRLGKEDDRHLWPEMLRAIREIQPRWVVGENVRGLTNWNGGLVFDEVQADLEAQGYEVLPFLLPACAVNAPHRRDRIWFVAYSSNPRIESLQPRGKNGIHGVGAITDTESEGSGRLSFGKETPHTINEGHGSIGYATYTNSGEFKTRMCKGQQKDRKKTGAGMDDRFTRFGDDGSGSERWGSFPTQSPVCNGNDGFSSKLDGITFPKWRNESIKAGGNAVVPQVVHQIFKAIEQYETM